MARGYHYGQVLHTLTTLGVHDRNSNEFKRCSRCCKMGKGKQGLQRMGVGAGGAGPEGVAVMERRWGRGVLGPRWRGRGGAQINRGGKKGRPESEAPPFPKQLRTGRRRCARPSEPGPPSTTLHTPPGGMVRGAGARIARRLFPSSLLPSHPGSPPPALKHPSSLSLPSASRRPGRGAVFAGEGRGRGGYTLAALYAKEVGREGGRRGRGER